MTLGADVLFAPASSIARSNLGLGVGTAPKAGVMTVIARNGGGQSPRAKQKDAPCKRGMAGKGNIAASAASGAKDTMDLAIDGYKIWTTRPP